MISSEKFFLSEQFQIYDSFSELETSTMQKLAFSVVK